MRVDWMVGVVLAIFIFPACASQQAVVPRDCVNIVLPDGHRKPLAIVSPKYPSWAARRGTAGFVRLRGYVSATGAVTNIEVQESSPSGTFDRAAKSAWSQWKYCPVVSGQDDTEPVIITLKFNIG